MLSSSRKFNYYTLIWLYSNRSSNNKINRLHERCLCIVYNNKKSHFEDLLKRDSSVSTHSQNKRLFAIKMFKVFKDIAPQIVK